MLQKSIEEAKTDYINRNGWNMSFLYKTYNKYM